LFAWVGVLLVYSRCKRALRQDHLSALEVRRAPSVVRHPSPRASTTIGARYRESYQHLTLGIPSELARSRSIHRGLLGSQWGLSRSRLPSWRR
jgi:hypothetical protein